MLLFDLAKILLILQNISIVMNFYNFFLTKIILPLGERILGSDYQKNLKTWRYYDSLSSEELKNIQNENLEKTLKYTIKTVPFYSSLKYDESKSAIQNLDSFPILTKNLLRKERENLVSQEFKVDELQKNYSSGSSGIQSYSYSVKNNKFLLQAIQGHWYEWSNYKIGDSILQFGISPNRVFPKNIKDILYKTLYQNAFSISEKDFEAIYYKLKKRKIKFIIGYPSAINEFSKYLIKNNYTHQIEGVISLGDKLFGHFEKNFNICFKNPKIIDTYGCAEGLMMGCRDDLPFYYIMSPHVYIEVVDNNNKPVKDGLLGNILVTCFTNKAQPFIRYRLGDLGAILPIEKYPKERKFNYQLIEKIVGRETDIVKTPNGKSLIVHSFTGIFEFYPEIKQYKIIQKNLNSIEIEYIIDAYFEFDASILEKIKSQIDAITDKSLDINFIKVEKIASTPSGKPQIIESLV
ncbi:MAG: phenylacetate-CoA ligase [Flavobacterium sp.]